MCQAGGAFLADPNEEGRPRLGLGLIDADYSATGNKGLSAPLQSKTDTFGELIDIRVNFRRYMNKAVAEGFNAAMTDGAAVQLNDIGYTVEYEPSDDHRNQRGADWCAQYQPIAGHGILHVQLSTDANYSTPCLLASQDVRPLFG